MCMTNMHKALALTKKSYWLQVLKKLGQPVFQIQKQKCQDNVCAVSWTYLGKNKNNISMFRTENTKEKAVKYKEGCYTTIIWVRYYVILVDRIDISDSKNILKIQSVRFSDIFKDN